jgi:carboxypeptidase Taq
MTLASVFTELTTLVQRAHSLGTVGELLGWDEQVNLPPGAADQRAAQLAVMAEVQHAADSDPRIGAALAGLEANLAAVELRPGRGGEAGASGF